MKLKAYKILYTLSIILTILFIVSTIFDYSTYRTTLNSAPFYLFVLVRSIEFAVPAIICAIIGSILKKKGK